MNAEKLLPLSICNVLEHDINIIKEYWAEKNSPAFIRVEGGEKRRLFIYAAMSYHKFPEMYSEDYQPFTPTEAINKLLYSDAIKQELLRILDRMLPGTAIVLLDSDSDSIESREIPQWFIV